MKNPLAGLTRLLTRWRTPRVENSTYRSPSDWLRDVFAPDDYVTPTKAMGVSGYFACIRCIAEDVGKLPLHTYRTAGRGKDKASDHPVYRLLHTEPNPEMGAMSFRETLTAHALGWSGGYAEIVRTQGGRPAQLWPIDPSTVTPVRDANGRLVYRVRVSGEQDVFLQARDVLHVHGLGYDAITGYAMSQLAANTIKSSRGATEFNANFFENAAQPSGTIEVPGPMSPTALAHLRESFAERHQGSKNAGRPVILEEGAKFTPTTVDPEKAQMVGSLQFQVEDLCRWFRVPPHKVQHLLRSTFSNIEQQSIEYVVDSLMPWLVRWEQEINRKLFGPNESNMFAKHQVNGLLRGDAAARSTYYREQWNIGALSQNDIRELEDMNPIGDAGDTYYVPMNVVPSDIAAAGPAQPSPDTPSPDPDSFASAFADPLEIAIGKIVKTESDKLDRAGARGDVEKVKAELYADLPRHYRAAVEPVLLSISNGWKAVRPTFSGLDVTQLAELFADQHVHASKVDLAERGKISDTRARNEASLILRTISNILR